MTRTRAAFGARWGNEFLPLVSERQEAIAAFHQSCQKLEQCREELVAKMGKSCGRWEGHSCSPPIHTRAGGKTPVIFARRIRNN